MKKSDFTLQSFPAFVDLKSVTLLDTIVIISIATIAVGGVKLIYAYLADKARLFLQNHQIAKIINFTAAVLMISTGIFLIAKN